MARTSKSSGKGLVPHKGGKVAGKGKPAPGVNLDPDAELTAFEEQFVNRYMIRLMASRAYLDLRPELAVSTARNKGAKLANKPNVKKEIMARRKEATARLKRTANRLLDETAALAFSNLADVFDSSGTIIPPSELPREVAIALKRVERREILGGDEVNEEGQPTGRKKVLGHTIKVEMHDKVTPLNLLGKHFGLFVEQVAVLGKDEFASVLREARERAAKVPAAEES